jgi:hypothetical protein
MTPSPISNEKLVECPFCGLTEHLSLQSVGSLTADMPARPYRVVCHFIDHDDVQGPVGYGRGEAIAAWNSRTESTRKRIAEQGEEDEATFDDEPTVPPLIADIVGSPFWADDPPEFRAWREAQDPASWAKLDLSAMRIGWEAGRAVARQENYHAFMTAARRLFNERYTEQKMAARRAAASPATGVRGGVVVKALEWQRENVDGTFWTGRAPLSGDYHVKFNGEVWEATRGIILVGTSDNADDCKRICDSDHEQRILSALNPTPAIGREDGR